MKQFRFATEKIESKYYKINLFGKYYVFSDNSPTFGGRFVVCLPGLSCGIFCHCQTCRIRKAIQEVSSIHKLSLYGVYNLDEIPDVSAVSNDEIAKTAEKAAGIVRITIPVSISLDLS